MADFNLTLESGLNFYTVSSAFQKCVRRGMEHEAMWFGTELYISGYEEYVWFRMKVMASEDVGIANPDLIVQMHALYQTYLEFKKKKNKHGPERLPFVHALQLLIRSPKSRLIDNVLSEYMFIRHTVEMPDLKDSKFDFVWDMHTLKGKQMGRGNDHFFEHAGHIENLPDWLENEEYEVRDRVWAKYNIEDKVEEDKKAKRLAARTNPRTQEDEEDEVSEVKVAKATSKTPDKNLFTDLEDE